MTGSSGDSGDGGSAVVPAGWLRPGLTQAERGWPYTADTDQANGGPTWRGERVQLIDDLDGTPATETVRFGLDGRDYLVDLNTEHAQRLRNAVGPFAAFARVVGPTRQTRRVLRIAVIPEV